eukprot:COSAG01_NODE_5112_length_4474_cov_395.839771_6_plen_79_part_01
MWFLLKKKKYSMSPHMSVMSVSHLSLMQVAASAFLLRSSLPSHQILLPPDTAPTTERAVASSSQRRGLPTPTQPHSRSL